MAELTTFDWDRIRALCCRAGLPPERVDRLEKNCASGPAAGVTLLVGNSKTVALFLARWLGSDAAAAMSASGGNPLVIGQNPDSIQPAVGHWPGLVSNEFGKRHLVAMESAGAIAGSLRSAIGSLGIADQVVIVSRLGQPLSADERQLVASTATVAATARVIFMALPSEHGTPDERSELAAYGMAQLEAHGFQGRCLGAGVWYAEGERPADTIQQLEEWLAVRPDDVASGRLAAGLAGLSTLLTEAEKSPDHPSETQLSIEEADDLGRKFAHYVGELGQRLKELADAGEFLDSAACRSFFVETLRGWLSRASLEGMLLDYVEHARPGMKAELREQAVEISEFLNYEPTSVSPTSQSQLSNGLPHRLGITAIAAIAAFGIVYFVGSMFLQVWFAIVLANLGSVVAALITFAATKDSPLVSPEKKAGEEVSENSAISGWASTELRLTNWFNHRIRSQTPSVRQECEAIRSQFRLESRRL